ncbi:MAG: UDP-N-acetylmuramoyl-L-alanine--D-glutamate ligase [Alphaproteobacteria bacterium]|jgi:UDP-N-acetylmuramoylalanine--D-glutamate ligase
MIEVFPFAGQPVAVFGLGRSGISAAKALTAGGAEVWAWDDAEASREKAAAAGVPLVDLYSCDWSALSSLVLSPGVPLTHPQPHAVVGLAKAANCEVIGDVELLARTIGNARYICVTGTNGKSTTTALIGHMLSFSGQDVEVGGNLGTPVLDLAPLEGGAYVIELSSYQIDLTVVLTCDIAVLLNITPDHIDRHGDFDHYAAVKKNIFHRQTSPRVAIVCVDDEPCRKIYQELVEAGDQRVIPVAVGRRVEGGVYVLDGMLYDNMDGGDVALIDLTEIETLPGAHNWQNTAAAYAAARANKVDALVASACLRGFPGLAHRQELICEIDGVTFINDSKATNVASAERALACYDTIYWIAGGRSKASGIAELAPYFPRIAHAFLIGEAAADFADTLDGDVDYSQCGDLESALGQAAAMAHKQGRDGAVVLLSPACASFDQFTDFEARGDAFRRLVEARASAPIVANGK